MSTEKKHIIADFPQGGHNHAICISDALAMAEKLCADHSVRLTELRRKVLELVWSSHKPLGAYDILEMLQEQRGVSAPPTVYRALDFLLAHKLIHRIESLNAYVGCASPNHLNGGQFLICKKCGTTAELDDYDLAKKIDDRAEGLGFQVLHQMIEVSGLCRDCVGDK